MNVCDVHELKALLERHGFHFSKRMGQNFLIAGWVPARIAGEAGLDQDCGVLEIGPGVGPLTTHLAARAGKVLSVELDASLLPILAETLAGHQNVEIIPGDIMKLDLTALLTERLAGLRPVACANLPYNITTPVLTRLLESRQFSSITVMLQKEAAQRICALPGDEDYGRFSVFCQYHAKCEILFEVPPSCFLPVPKVTSAILRMVPNSAPLLPPEQEKIFLRLIRSAFAQRRKTLLNCLASSFGGRFSKEELREALLRCGLPEDVRGERLAPPDFFPLTDFLK